MCVLITKSKILTICNMKRISYFFASVALVFGAMGMAAAQEVTTTEEVISEEVTNSHRYEVGSFADNWSIGVGGGVNMYFGEHDRQMNFGDRLSPNLDVYVAKWFTPVVGFRLGYTGLNFRGATNIVTGTPNSTGEIYEPYKDDHQPLYWQKFNFFNIHADFMLNLVNLIGGYKERVFNTSLYAGIGLARAYPHKSVAENPVANNRHSGNLGLFNTFRLCDALDLNIDFRGTLLPESFDGEVGVRPGGGDVYESDGFFTASIGLAYKFKPRGWSQGKTIYRTRTATTKVVDEAALSALKADNAALQQALAKARAEAFVEHFQHMPGYLVTFNINSSKVQKKDRVNLGKIAEVLKETDDSVVLLLTGYADEGTGTVKINERLSRERAQAVYDCLVNEFGVKPEKLATDFKGGVENMFYDDAVLSRSVVISLK